MKIVCISDTHMQLNKIILPPGDVLVCAGDIANYGYEFEIIKELNILASHKDKFKEIIYVPGNHDIDAQRKPVVIREACQELGINLLIDEPKVIDDVFFYGSPWQPEFCNWAFNLPRGPYLKKIWENIPDETNVLVTHSPAYGIGDKCFDGREVGCEDLLYRIQELQELKNLKAHVFGHIHYSYGVYALGKSLEELSSTTFINAAICQENYEPLNKPITINL